MLSHSDRAALLAHALDPDATDVVRCPECDGRREIADVSPDTGRWITLRCPRCDGAGLVPERDPDDLDAADAA